VSTTLSRAVSVAPTGIRTARSACCATTWRPVAWALAVSRAVRLALRAVVRAADRVRRALALALRRLRVAAAFLAAALRWAVVRAPPLLRWLVVRAPPLRWLVRAPPLRRVDERRVVLERRVVDWVAMLGLLLALSG
jgi:hypothetical protein